MGPSGLVVDDCIIELHVQIAYVAYRLTFAFDKDYIADDAFLRELLDEAHCFLSKGCGAVQHCVDNEYSDWKWNIVEGIRVMLERMKPAPDDSQVAVLHKAELTHVLTVMWRNAIEMAKQLNSQQSVQKCKAAPGRTAIYAY